MEGSTDRPAAGWTGLDCAIWNGLLDSGLTAGEADTLVRVIQPSLTDVRQLIRGMEADAYDHQRRAEAHRKRREWANEEADQLAAKVLSAWAEKLRKALL